MNIESRRYFFIRSIQNNWNNDNCISFISGFRKRFDGCRKFILQPSYYWLVKLVNLNDFGYFYIVKRMRQKKNGLDETISTYVESKKINKKLHCLKLYLLFYKLKNWILYTIPTFFLTKVILSKLRYFISNSLVYWHFMKDNG